MTESEIEPEFAKMNGLIPAVVQDINTGTVLMVAFMNKAAWDMTRKTGLATYFSRSRNTLWVKGKTSGHLQRVREIRLDCDNDTVLLKVEQAGGAACHTGYYSCFYKRIEPDDTLSIPDPPVFDPREVYRK